MGDVQRMRPAVPLSPMTKGEREELQRLIRQRERVQKSAARQRSTELLADFENQLASEFSFDDDAVWQQAADVVEGEVAKANKLIAAQCRKLGIPRRFAPSIGTHWHVRGFDNSTKERRAELRRVAQSRIAALEQAAIVNIERDAVNAATEIAANGMTSEAARTFLAQLKPVEELMPALSFEEIAGPADPPVAEQLVSPGALRQRRYRQRHRNARVTSRNANDKADNADNDDEA